MSVDVGTATRKFMDEFGGPPEVGARAPGRVNIIGEHTDYNDGFVLPMAIENETVILARPRADMVFHMYAANLGRRGSVSLDAFVRQPDEPWMDYVIGTARELSAAGKPLCGADMMIIGDVPLESGLSSSASLEMAALRLFETMGGFEIGGPQGAMLGRRVENEFLGLKSGIMDQFIIRVGRRGHALFLDSRSLDYELVPVAFSDAVFVIANTCVRRGLTSSKYNERVAECAEAARAIGAVVDKQVESLRDVTDLDQIETARDAMPETVYRRARHVVTENARTVAACEAMKSSDAAALGTLMNESHESLRDDYEVSCPELDVMSELARSHDCCYGSRMTGAGFGGCTVSLVHAADVESFCASLMEQYRAATGIEGAAIVSLPAQGATNLELR
ncbi:MAG: galactokinase [Candidatus Hydrogenedentes bacterium]|nr:galactokinase [Candidatus Hydrogenedentota bacterium]